MNAKVKARIDTATKNTKQVWAGPSFVRDLTGWTGEKLRQAREQGLLSFKRSAGGGWLYDINSIPDRLLKVKSTL